MLFGVGVARTKSALSWLPKGKFVLRLKLWEPRMARSAALAAPAPSVLPVNPAAFPPGRIRAEAARRFADFLVEAETRERIANFGDGLFVPIEAPR